ncbi:response regulator [Undibacterium sp. SXout7W]|uniref:response regulator n=1 Tax=Undibacterium sp. SXout7W TaxID=3413049 RepID=UPI003BF4E0FB
MTGLKPFSSLTCSIADAGDDSIDFLDEEAESFHPGLATHPLKILIADDDRNVHETTVLALNGIKIHNRSLEFFHAYSAKEAQLILEQHADIALILLDVVMETVDAGLKLVGLIRNELKLTNLRIVLRTGQPGYAPEQQISQELAIDGYTTKSKLTRSMLISVLNETLSNISISGNEKPN